MASGNELHRKDPIMFSSLSLLCCRSSIIDFQLSLLLLSEFSYAHISLRLTQLEQEGFRPSH